MGFYSKKASLLQAGCQTPDLVGAAALATFQPYKNKGGAGGVMGMIENIVNESKHVEDESRAAEQEAQAGYEQSMVDSGNAIKALQADITDKQAFVAAADGDLVRAKKDLAAVGGDLEDLNQYNKELHSECDFITHNFVTRQQARTDEVKALDQPEANGKALQASADAKGDLQDTTTSRDANSKYPADLTVTCEQKFAAFAERQQLRADEIAAVEKAVEILSNGAISGASEKHLPQLLQSSALAQLRSETQIDSA